jgi:hypothetical protein
MKVSSRDLYARLRDVLAPSMKAAGFRRLKGSTLGWSRPAGPGTTNAWFQCDRYGWDASFGSSFTLEFRMAANAGTGMGSVPSLQRFPTLLSLVDLEHVRQLNNAILGSLPEIGPDHPYRLLPTEYLEAVMSKYRPQLEPYNPNLDPWAHFYSADHVDQWARFFEPRLIPMAERFAEMRPDDSGQVGAGVVV